MDGLIDRGRRATSACTRRTAGWPATRAPWTPPTRSSSTSPTSSCCPSIAGTAGASSSCGSPSTKARIAARRWILHTADAHGLYEKLGFAPGERLLERAAR